MTCVAMFLLSSLSDFTTVNKPSFCNTLNFSTPLLSRWSPPSLSQSLSHTHTNTHTHSLTQRHLTHCFSYTHYHQSSRKKSTQLKCLISWKPASDRIVGMQGMGPVCVRVCVYVCVWSIENWTHPLLNFTSSNLHTHSLYQHSEH